MGMEGENQDLDVDESLVVARFRSPKLAAVGGALVLVGILTDLLLLSSVSYYLEPDKPRDLGRIEDALAKKRLVANRHVAFTGLPLVRSEGKLDTKGESSWCVAGNNGSRYFLILASTGNRVVVQTKRGGRMNTGPTRERFSGFRKVDGGDSSG